MTWAYTIPLIEKNNNLVKRREENKVKNFS